MKIGSLNDIVGCAVVTVAVLGPIYTGVAAGTIWIQDTFFYDFRGTVQVRGTELNYKGVKPYDSFMLWRWQDKNGRAEVWLEDDKYALVRIEDLTASPLDGRVMVRGPNGIESQFNDETEYDGNTSQEIEELERDSKSAVIEQAIKEAIAGR